MPAPFTNQNTLFDKLCGFAKPVPHAQHHGKAIP
jgi:hypothetical protein